jgi:primase-polymerase (primpol)-like protein
MVESVCEFCGGSNLLSRKGARFCSPKCRVYWHRASARLPRELMSRDRWIRRSSSKVPLTVAGSAASSTDPATWSNHADAAKSSAGAGLGFVLNGDGIACYDLDHCVENGVLSPRAQEFLDAHKGFYSEFSPSGDGIHIWVFSPAGKGWRKTVDGLNVEFYSTGRYITITGKSLKHMS